MNTNDTKPTRPIEYVNGMAFWHHTDGDRYTVTGVDRGGKRFRVSYDRWQWAAGINVFRGSKWLVRDGKRHLIQRVWN